MELIKTVIHELIKQPAKNDTPEVPAQVSLANELLDVSQPAVIKLVESIQSVYGTKGNSSSQGTFELNGSFQFPTRFSKFLNNKINDTSFLQLTTHSMHIIRNKAADKNFATGGYIVFAYYKQNNQPFVIAAMVKKKDGIQLTNLKPETIQEVDLSKLHQAIKINIHNYLDAMEKIENNLEFSGSYLSFISPKSNLSTSGYFISAFGCTDALPAATATNNAIEAVVQFFEDDDKLKHLKNEAYDKVVGLLESTLKKEEKTCSIDELNHLVNSLVPSDIYQEYLDTFVKFSNNDPFNVPDMFYTHSTTVTKAKKVNLKGLDGAWTLKFDKRLLGTDENSDIQYNSSNGGSLTLRNLDPETKNEILKSLKERC